MWKLCLRKSTESDGIILEIKELNLDHFGKFSHYSVTLSPGLNVIQGENEAGKSTIHSFVRGMLFGIEKKRGRESKNDLYSRYQPWDTPGAYQGSMVVKKDGKEYQVVRSFLQKEASLCVTDLSSGREIPNREVEQTGLYGQLSEDVYRNTVSMEQLKASTDSEFADRLQNYIANLSMTKSNEVDLAGAIQRLKERKKAEGREKIAEALRAETERLKSLAQKVETFDRLSDDFVRLQKEEEQLKENHARKREPFSGNRQIVLDRLCDRNEQYTVIQQEIESFNRILQERTQKIAELREDKSTVEQIDADLKEYLRLREKAHELELDRNRKKEQEEEKLFKESHKEKILCAIGGIAAFLFTIFFAVMQILPAVGICVGLIAVIGIIYMYLLSKREKKYQAWQEKHREEMAAQLHLEDGQKEILVRHYVPDADGLRKKYAQKVAEESELKHLAEQQLSDENELKKKSERAKQLMEEMQEYRVQFPELEEINGESLALLTERVRKEKEEEEQEERQYSENAEQLRLEMERVRWEMDTLADASNLLNECKENCRELENSLDKADRNIAAQDAAINLIQSLSLKIHDSFGEQLNERISENVREITHGAYDKVAMNEQLQIKVHSNFGYLALEKLSAGTICQIYLAVRMAMADVFFEEEPVPLLFDDAFALYDDQRIASALAYLAQRKQQILIFTCHTREARVLTELGLPYHLVRLER